MESEHTSDFLGAQSVERSLALLVAVARFRGAGASLGEIVGETDLKQPTARRLLLALIRAGLIEQDEQSRRYFLGPECYVLGTIAAERYGIHRIATEGLRRLAKWSQDTSFITVRNGTYGVCLERQEGTYPIRSHVLAAGDRLPLCVSAGCLAMLAALPDDDVDQIVRTHGAVCAERYPLLTVPRLRELIASARSRGFAVNPGLIFPESWAIGVAIRDFHGEPIAALSVGAIESRMSEARQHELAAALHDEARIVEAQLRELLVVRPSLPTVRTTSPARRKRA